MNRKERESEFRAKIAKLDAYVEEMNAKGNLTDEEEKEVWSAMLQTNRYLRAITDSIINITLYSKDG